MHQLGMVAPIGRGGHENLGLVIGLGFAASGVLHSDPATTPGTASYLTSAFGGHWLSAASGGFQWCRGLS